MSATIKAKDIKPGMEIEWDEGGFIVHGTVNGVEDRDSSNKVLAVSADPAGMSQYLHYDREVKVLKFPSPEEPKGFGAVVSIDGDLAVRCEFTTNEHSRPWRYREGLTNWSWDDLPLSNFNVEVLSEGVEV